VQLWAVVHAEVWVSRGTAARPTATGGTVLADRIVGKLQTRVTLHHHCLGDWLELEEEPEDLGWFYPVSRKNPMSNESKLMFRRARLVLSCTVTDQ
jgi:hypothetical protein